MPADALYEWKATGTTKQPFAIALRDRQLFAFAGLWENWKDPSSTQWVRTFTILTTKPNELVAPLHDRMPLILAQAEYEEWLDPTHDPASLIRPYPANEMTAWPISTRVNRLENDDPGILDIEVSSSPIDAEACFQVNPDSTVPEVIRPMPTFSPKMLNQESS